MHASDSSRKDQPLGSILGKFFLHLLILAGSFYGIELLAWLLLEPVPLSGLVFGGFWALILAGLILLLPRKAGRIVFGILYYILLLWTLAQAGYYQVFGKLMWISTVSYAGEGAAFLGDVISGFPVLWWLGGVLMLGFGVLVLWKFPHPLPRFILRLPYLLFITIGICGLCILPEVVFLRDKEVWGTRSEYGQSSSWRATYNTMYDARRVYDICGMYQLLMRDVWKHELYPLTPAYRESKAIESAFIDGYFAARGEHENNSMTGIFQGKNVILVLMESMDDWMITEADTPTLSRLMDEGIHFTNFYTPGYGSARTLNTEFCMNTGIYLPTTGNYVFDYVTNSYDQSIANQLTANGYTAEVFHYNTPEFYSRGVFEPAMGYGSYHCYADYTTDEDALYSDTLLFDIPEISDVFFREGPTFNTIITRSAHLSYKYNEVLSYYGLKLYPEYRGLYGSEEEDCARMKAKLVDDLFARLLAELEAQGQLQNTVIIGITDHYTYGYKNLDELLAHSGVSHEILLEKTPCFIWSADKPNLDVDKTLNTADLLPTVLNIMGIDSPYDYLGQDAFDPDYPGYVFFPDGSWAWNGIFCKIHDSGEPEILLNENNIEITEDLISRMDAAAQEFILVSNQLLTADYYADNS